MILYLYSIYFLADKGKKIVLIILIAYSVNVPQKKLQRPIKVHSWEIKGFWSTWPTREMLQNLLCLWKKKTHVVFFVFHFKQLSFFPLVYLYIYQSIHKEKIKVAWNEKWKKLHGFFFINIANFEAFFRELSWPKTFYFWRVTCM